jgi:hypothetical protein
LSNLVEFLTSKRVLIIATRYTVKLAEIMGTYKMGKLAIYWWLPCVSVLADRSSSELQVETDGWTQETTVCAVWILYCSEKLWQWRMGCHSRWYICSQGISSIYISILLSGALRWWFLFPFLSANILHGSKR